MDTEKTEKDIMNLLNVIQNTTKSCLDLRLFLITEREFIRIYHGRITRTWYNEEYGIVKSLKLERGKVLDVFSKLEFLVNELIRLKIYGPTWKGEFILDDILEYIDFFSRIKCLEKWKIIDNSLLNLLMQTKQVRNGFAHAWDEKEITYKANELKGNFSNFRKDMKKIWKQLIDIYKKEQQKIEIENIINEIKNA